MKIIFLGTPYFALPALQEILLCGHHVAAVVCNRDKPAGRGGKVEESPVKKFALENQIPVLQYSSVRKEGVEDIRQLAPDLMVTCAFGQILSQELLDIPKFGVMNVHVSLLPKYRGASPVQSVLLSGEKETGVTIMKTEAGIDDGDIYLQEKLIILDGETYGELTDRIFPFGAKLLGKALKLLEEGKLTRTPQNYAQATFCSKIGKENAKLDFSKSAVLLERQIRAFNPAPGCFFEWKGENYKVLKAEIADWKEEKARNGTVLLSSPKQGLFIQTGSGVLSVLCIQAPGGKPMEIQAFLNGRKIPEGETL